MKPVVIGNAELYLGDFRDLVGELPAVDVIVTDPPYGETSLEWDRRVPLWPDSAYRMLKPAGSLWCFGSIRFFMETAHEFSLWSLAQDCLWEKHNGSNSANDRFRRVHEHAAQFYPAGAKWRDVFKKPLYTDDAVARAVTRSKNRTRQWGDTGTSSYVSHDGGPLMMRSVMFARSCHGFAIHETQKPEEVYEPLVEYSCPSDGVALDIFSGGGTLAVVCNRRGIRSISIERSAVRFEAACERITNAQRQQSMFDPHDAVTRSYDQASLLP